MNGNPYCDTCGTSRNKIKQALKNDYLVYCHSTKCALVEEQKKYYLSIIKDLRKELECYVSDLIEDGMYIGTVVKADIIDSEYMINQYNPQGTCLNLWIDVPREDDDGTKRLFRRMNRGEVNTLLSALGRETTKDLVTFDPSFLLKRQFVVEVQQYTSKVGKVSNIVKTMTPASEGKVDF